MFVFAIARPLLAKVKVSTGIPGLKVLPNARDVLIDLYTQTLRDVKGLQGVKHGNYYRAAMEAMVKARLKVCQEEHDWEAIESRLGFGQIEDLVDQAREDLALVRKFIGISLRKIHKHQFHMSCFCIFPHTKSPTFCIPSDYFDIFKLKTRNIESLWFRMLCGDSYLYFFQQ